MTYMTKLMHVHNVHVYMYAGSNSTAPTIVCSETDTSVSKWCEINENYNAWLTILVYAQRFMYHYSHILTT